MSIRNGLKRSLAALLAIVLVLSCLPLSVFAAEGEEPVPGEGNTITENIQPSEVPVPSTVNTVEEEDEDEPPVATEATIGEVLSAAEGTFIIEGVVTQVDGQNYEVNDGTGAICVRLKDAHSDIALGATIQVTGTRWTEDGEAWLTDATAEVTQKAQTTTKGTMTTAETPETKSGAAGNTWKKITKADELTTGQYVLVTSAGYAPLVYSSDSNGWVTVEQPIIENGTVTDTKKAEWTITVNNGSATLTDSNGVFIAPKGGNTNGIQSGEYSWAVAFADGTFTFSGTGEDTVTLASNKGSENKVRAYKTATVSNYPNSYLSAFTLYKLDEGTSGGETTDPTEPKPTEPKPTEPETPAVTQTATLVTDVTSLAVGDEVIIAATGYNYALSTTQNDNNRGQAEVTKNGDVVTFGEDTQILTLAAGTADGTWAFYTGEGYLYAASSSKNNMKTQTTLDANGSWSIEMDDTGAATLLAKGGNTRNWMRYNASPGLFSCYAETSTTMQDIAIYKVDKGSTADPDPWADEDAKYSIYQQITELTDGDKVVLFNPGNGKALSSQFSGYYLAGVDATVKEAGYIASDADYIEWTVSITETDGKKVYTFKQGDDVVLGVLQSGTYYNPKTGVGETTDTGWYMEKTGDESNQYYIYSSTLESSYENGHIYLNWYAKKTAFSPNNTSYNSETNYGFSFYKLVRAGVKEDKPVTPAPTIKSGEYVIWDVVNKKALSSQRTKEGSFYYKGVDVTETDGVLSGYGDTEIWTVTVEDGKLTFTAGEEKLGMSGTYGSISNASGCTTWVVEDAGDGAYYIQNTETGKYMLFSTQYSSWQATADKASASKLKLTAPVDDTKPASGIADGNYVIWNPNYNMAVSNSFNSSNYMLGTSVTPVGDTVTGYGNIDIWTVKNNDDGTMTISQNGKYFGNNASGYIVVEEAPANPNWKLTTLEDGTIYLTNAGSGKDLEWFANYSDWSMYYYKEADKAMYALKFTPASTVYDTDSEVVSDIAQWGGGGPYDATTNAAQVLGDRYVVGDQKDTNAVFTVVAKGVTAQPYQTTTPATGGTNYYMGGTNIGASAGDYMQFAVNTAGWGDMTLAFRMRATATAPGSFQLCYSTDGGTTWNNFNTGSYAYSYTAWNSDGSYPVNGSGNITDGVAKTSLAATQYVSFSFDVPTGADNCENLLIRLVAGTTRADGDTTKAISGNIRIDSVSLSGSPIVDSSVTTHVTVDPNGVDEDQAVDTQLTMTSEEGATIYYRVDGGDWQTYDPENKPTLEKLPCDIEVYAKAEGKTASGVMLYHYAAGTVANVKMSPNGGSVWVPSENESVQVTLSTATDGATIYYAIADKDGNYETDEGNVEWKVYTEETTISLEKGFGSKKMKAYAVKDGFTDSAVNEKTFTERASETFNIYFGQLHSHTNISDGAGSIEEAYAHGSKLDTLDFLAVTDHSNSFDVAGSGVLAKDATEYSTDWKTAKQTAAQYTTENFVGLYGYEMTWSNGLGHMNTYNTPGFQSRTQSEYSTYATALKNYYDTLTTVNDSISQFNHPGTTFGDFQDFSYYTEAYDDLITLIEVGNGEGAIGSSGYFPSYEYYTRALDKGWHVAPTNNQDNHKGLWGDANTARSVVLADSLTEESIYDAMRNYRVYATEDNDLNIYYTLNGNIMGTILSSGDVDGPVEISVLLSDATDKVDGTKVQVIVNGGLVAAETTIAESKTRTNEKQEEVTFTVPADYSYYYIKVVQPDGDIAVTAPVWVGEVESVGISSFTTDAAVAVKDQEMNLTLELYNNIKKDLEIQSIVFQLGDSDDPENKPEVIHTADLTNIRTVKKMSTASYSFAYTHRTVGNTQIYAVVTGKLNGVEKIYKEKLDLTFVPDKMVTRVIVDGTHYNDYVTGYYGGNITNLTTIAAESQIEVSIVKDKITAEMLENCQLLIISAPAKKSGTANTGDYVAKPFEDDFIALVKQYVEDGGSVVVCGLADYSEGSCDAELHTAYQINKLLTALGSTMRLNDDEVWDDELNGGQSYRLYPTNFNTDSKWCKGIVTGDDGQQYSQYSGCSVNPGDGTWLVKGFDSTLGVDSDKDGVGASSETFTDATGAYTYNVVTPKGDVVFLAAEDTGHGGTIFAAGGVFVSDFEVKAELDNIWDLPYANRTIIENILGVVKVELPLTSIADMRKGELGDVFRIRGYATSGTDNKDTTFFDAIYVQDDTGGTTVFPFTEAGVAIGTPIEIVGYVDEYQGDREIQVMSYKILDIDSKVYEPEKMSNKDAMDYDKNGGKLIQVEGKVVEVITSGETGVAQFVVEDKDGNKAKVFIDGYILSGTTSKNELASTVKLGATVSAVGLLYMHPEGDSDVSIPVLRVRDCDEVKAVGGTGTETGTKHDVKVTVQGDGTATVDPTTAKKDEIVTITTTPEKGYAVKSVTVNGGDVKVTAGKDGKYTFPMPDGDVEVKVTFEKYYTVSIKENKNGTITVSNEHPFAGDTVTITVKPKSGKELNSVKVLDSNNKKVKLTKKDGEYTFTMPEDDVTVSATYKTASSKTGDTSHVKLYVAIMVVAVIALVVLLLGRKKWFKK